MRGLCDVLEHETDATTVRCCSGNFAEMGIEWAYSSPEKPKRFTEGSPVLAHLGSRGIRPPLLTWRNTPRLPKGGLLRAEATRLFFWGKQMIHEEFDFSKTVIR